MKNGQWRETRRQDGSAPRAARTLDFESATQSRGMAARGEPAGGAIGPRALAVREALQALHAAVHAVVELDEMALVRDWCVRALGELALGLWEDGAPTPPSGHAAAAATTRALTTRQAEVMRRLREGERPKEIAHALHLAELTVRSHIRDAIERLGAHGTQAAVKEADRRGLLDLTP